MPVSLPTSKLPGNQYEARSSRGPKDAAAALLSSLAEVQSQLLLLSPTLADTVQYQEIVQLGGLWGLLPGKRIFKDYIVQFSLPAHPSFQLFNFVLGLTWLSSWHF